MYQVLTFIIVLQLTMTNFLSAQDATATESKRLNEWFDKVFDEAVDRSPVWQAYLGIKKDYDKWDDDSEAKAIKELNITKANLQFLKNNFDYSKLDEGTKVSYDLYVADAEKEIKNFEYRHYNYPVNQMFGTHSWIPSFLIDIHKIANEKEALDYIARVNGVEALMNRLIDNLKIRELQEIIAPKFVFALVLSDCNNLLKGKPFDKGDNHAIYDDFTTKVNQLDGVSEARKTELIAQLEKALLDSFQPGYKALITYLKSLEKKANNDAGVWKFKNGDKFYDAQLASTTTTNLTGQQIFDTGNKEVARIHDEMRQIMKQVNFKSDNLKEFFKFMETDKQFYYTNDETGKAQCMADNQKIIDDMKLRLPDLFYTFPKAQLTVKAVEPYREKTAGEAFYQGPAPDGSRPGVYYINLYDMQQMPKYQLEALAYHEAIPGHHMQISIQQELQGLPKFRTLGGGYTAYVEGWGLYSELVPKEIGFYQDPYSDFGRLAMELWRACRLVADVGIHQKKWTREQAIQFYKDNTPASEGECAKMVERHIVMPSQATAYKVGQMKILALRAMAKDKLGNQFDIKAFHYIVLKNGALPLNVLEDMVNRWITQSLNKK
jgi:uncharacterized protein (DUF885 family)